VSSVMSQKNIANRRAEINPSPVLRTPSPHPMGRGMGEGRGCIEINAQVVKKR
jgi:hypothetical protein